MRFPILFPVPISLRKYSSYSLWQSREKRSGIPLQEFRSFLYGARSGSVASVTQPEGGVVDSFVMEPLLLVFERIFRPVAEIGRKR